MGLLRTKVDKRYSMTKKAEEGLRELLASMKFKMFDTYIPTDSNIEKSQWTGFPLRKYVAENNKYSRANKAFYDVAKEVVANARQ
jgi:cellulose biosynthesis protein BcsQ